MEFEYSADILDEKQRLEFIFYSFRRACDLKQNGYNYATTVGVQMLMECMEDMIIGWKKPKQEENEWKVEPIFSPISLTELENRIENFEKHWFFGKDRKTST